MLDKALERQQSATGVHDVWRIFDNRHETDTKMNCGKGADRVSAQGRADYHRRHRLLTRKGPHPPSKSKHAARCQRSESLLGSNLSPEILACRMMTALDISNATRHVL